MTKKKLFFALIFFDLYKYIYLYIKIICKLYLFLVCTIFRRCAYVFLFYFNTHGCLVEPNSQGSYRFNLIPRRKTRAQSEFPNRILILCRQTTVLALNYLLSWTRNSYILLASQIIFMCEILFFHDILFTCYYYRKQKDHTLIPRQPSLLLLSEYMPTKL